MTPNATKGLRAPVVDATKYVNQKQVTLARAIKNRTKVYLDTKFWLILRDVRLGRNDCQHARNLLIALERRVDEGSLICPFNHEIYAEVLKQSDERTLVATAQLIDDLSLGVCIIPVIKRLELEVYHFIESCLRSKERLFEMDEPVWTKTAYVLGFVTPDCYNLPDNVNVAVQKAFIDHMWTLGFSDFLNVVGPSNASALRFPSTDISHELNAGKLAHFEDHKSFKGIFLSEVRGIVDELADSFEDLLRHIYSRETGNAVIGNESLDTSGGRAIANLIYHSFRLNKDQNKFPSIRIGAGLHAAVRSDRNRKYVANDSYDFRHAIAALPYCDLFFTEAPLHSIIQNGNLKFATYFKCKTFSKPSEALASVNGPT